MRPGRFDRHITIDRPAKDGREAILKVHCRRVPLSDDVDLGSVAGATIGFSGAALKNLVNEAALSAARSGRTRVTAEDFDFAQDLIEQMNLKYELNLIRGIDSFDTILFDFEHRDNRKTSFWLVNSKTKKQSKKWQRFPWRWGPPVFFW